MLLQCESERSTSSRELFIKRQLKLIITPKYRMAARVRLTTVVCALTEIIAYLSDDEAALLSSYYSTMLNNNISDMTDFWNDKDDISSLFSKIEIAYNQINFRKFDEFKAMRFRRMLMEHIDDEEFIMRKINFTRYQTSALLNFCRAFEQV